MRLTSHVNRDLSPSATGGPAVQLWSSYILELHCYEVAKNMRKRTTLLGLQGILTWILRE